MRSVQCFHDVVQLDVKREDLFRHELLTSDAMIDSDEPLNLVLFRWSLIMAFCCGAASVHAGNTLKQGQWIS